MPSKKPSNTSLRGKRRRFRYFIDRSLGSVFLPEQLRAAGFDIVVHDDIYQQTERDPWIFYECGKKGLIVVTSDLAFRKSFPHIAAIALARTSVIAFTNNNFKSEIRGKAFMKARPHFEKALRQHLGGYFIGVVGTGGTFRVCEESPMPSRKTCDDRDWTSYERVCNKEGVLALAPQALKKKSG